MSVPPILKLPADCLALRARKFFQGRDKCFAKNSNLTQQQSNSLALNLLFVAHTTAAKPNGSPELNPPAKGCRLIGIEEEQKVPKSK